MLQLSYHVPGIHLSISHTLSINYDYLLAIIYKLEIIYKATKAPTNEDQQSCSINVNIGSIELFGMTISYDQHTLSTRQQVCAPLFFSFVHTSLIKHILIFLF